MNLFFILGAPRSGSKVYSNFINNSFDVKVFEELHFKRPDLVGKVLLHNMEVHETISKE